MKDVKLNEFNTFNDVENTLLRTYNRSVTALSINEDYPHLVEPYLAQFSKQDNGAIMALLLGIKKYGKEKINQVVTVRVHQQEKQVAESQ